MRLALQYYYGLLLNLYNRLQYQLNRMINEITINSNNAIQMSRGELLSWVNDLLKVNLAKIEQLGTGAVYCQLIDILYPGKLAMNKVNWKAKFDYEFVVNFKVLQQSFTKLGIMKHIEVQKLVKCKYQDNLQFLQWFKKIFDSSGVTCRDYNPVLRRGDAQMQTQKKSDRDKQNRVSILSSSSKQMFTSNSKSFLEIPERSNFSRCPSLQFSDQTDQNDSLKIPFSALKPNHLMSNPPNSPEKCMIVLDSPWRDEIKERTCMEEKEFYLRKFKEIEHLMQDWAAERSSGELIQQVRKIMFAVPTLDWTVQNGQFVERQKSTEFELRERQNV